MTDYDDSDYFAYGKRRRGVDAIEAEIEREEFAEAMIFDRDDEDSELTKEEGINWMRPA
jgi:hypothetical protein